MIHAKRLLLLLLICSFAAQAEWTNRYPKVDGQRHHIYLESYELPILSSGPKYPAPSPDGKSIAFASHGWIWVMDINTQMAKRVTKGESIDGRPRWSGDSKHLAFVRDSSTDSSIVIIELGTNKTIEINTPTIELDPEFAPDGKSIYLSSGKSGLLNIWKYSLNDGAMTMVTDLDGHSRNPRLSSDGRTLFFSHLDWPERQIRSLSLESGKETILKTDSIGGQFSFDMHPTKDVVGYTWPVNDDLNLMLADVAIFNSIINLTPGSTYVQDPAWSADGSSIYYSEPDPQQQFKLMQVSAVGGSSKEIQIKNWDWGQKTAKLTITTRLNHKTTPVRLSVKGPNGHPIVNPNAATYFDSQNGLHYFYSDGSVDLEVPEGNIYITAVHGMTGLPAERMVSVTGDSKIVIPVEEVWNAKKAGYRSADFHLHLNYDGPYRQVTKDIEPLIAGENLDLATPQAANLHNRLMDREFLGETLRARSGSLIKFAQEVRSHFHGHIGVVGPSEFYFPWFWGPGYPTLNNGDLSNASVFEFVESFKDSIGTYVHPVVYNVNPFDHKKASTIPLEFIPDSILSSHVGLELVCAWSDELGTAELWYRLLNIGRPVIAMAGTDMFVDFHRTPAIGTARVYAEQSQNKLQWTSYINAVKQGRTFVTNAPVLLLELDGKIKPGDVILSGKQSFSLQASSAIAVDNIELVVNGEIVWSGGSIDAGDSQTFNGQIDLPEGGWVAARAHGGEASWPLMDSYPFGHTSPIWINSKGSTEPAAKTKATRELRRALNDIEERARLAYKGENISALLTRINDAREAISD